MLKQPTAYLPGLAALAAVCILAAAAPAFADPRHDDRRYDDRRDHHWDHRDHRWDHHRDWRRGYGYGGGYYAPPPVVYSRPYYAPPPVVYGPAFGLNIHIP